MCKRVVSFFLMLVLLVGLIPVAAQAAEVPIQLDTDTVAAISAGGEMVYFSFTPEETKNYTFYSIGDSDTFGCIYDSGMNPLASDDDLGTDKNFSIAYTMEAGTSYILGAKFLNQSHTGSFIVRLEESQIPASTPIQLNTDTTVTISDDGGIAWFSFVPQETKQYVFYSVGTSDTYGCIYDSGMNELASNDDDGADGNFSLTCTLEAGATYILSAKFLNSSDTGTFTVRLEALRSNGHFHYDYAEMLKRYLSGWDVAAIAKMMRYWTGWNAKLR